MMKSWIVLAGAGWLLAGCANASHPAGATLGAAPAAVNRCAGCGNTDPGHQQYYDEHAHRYYYYDGSSGRYLWEDGAPRG